MPSMENYSNPWRPILKRFENHTTKIWEKHGIKPAGFWTVLIGDGNHDLHYFIAWESLADREEHCRFCPRQKYMPPLKDAPVHAIQRYRAANLCGT